MKSLGMVVVLCFLVSCAPEIEVEDEEVGTRCTVDTDCETPARFMVRSSCPFMASCIDNKCAVVCPEIESIDPFGPEPIRFYECNSDSDCNCAYGGEDFIRCVCARGKCQSVVAE